MRVYQFRHVGTDYCKHYAYFRVDGNPSTLRYCMLY